MEIIEIRKRQEYVLSAGFNTMHQIAGFMENICTTHYALTAAEVERQLLNVKESVDLLIVGYEQNFGEMKCRKRTRKSPSKATD